MRLPIAPRPMKPIALIVSLPLVEVLVGEFEARRGDDRVDLIGSPEADDRAVDSRVTQRPASMLTIQVQGSPEAAPSVSWPLIRGSSPRGHSPLRATAATVITRILRSSAGDQFSM
jgi:hypothetical protein